MKLVNLEIIYSFGNAKLIFHSPFYHNKAGILGEMAEIYPYSSAKIENFLHSDRIKSLVFEINAISKLLNNFKVITVNVQFNDFLLMRLFSRAISSLLSAKLYICSWNPKNSMTNFVEEFSDQCKVYLLENHDEADVNVSSLNRVSWMKSMIDALSRTAKGLKVILLPSDLGQKPNQIYCDLTFVLDDEIYSTSTKTRNLSHESMDQLKQTEKHQPLKMKTRWSDIGGLEKVKKILRESILDPIQVRK